MHNLARPQSYDRGEDYYKRGAVREVTRRGDLLRAAVEGSQYEPYQVQIELDETGVVDTSCSCPYCGFSCELLDSSYGAFVVRI